MTWQIFEGGCIDRLRELDAGSVQTCVTSPPYWGLRDYGAEGQLGLEPTPEEYVANMVDVFREVKRVLRDDGTLWLNLGDSYAGSGKGPSNKGGEHQHLDGISPIKRNGQQFANGQAPTEWLPVPQGLKPKDLCGIPWRVAFALQADGWYLRSDIIWAKPNPMPESVTDRPTRSHEYIFLLTKSARYFYDAEAIREDGAGRLDRWPGSGGRIGEQGWTATALDEPAGRNKRSVWTVTTRPYSEAHFATFPPQLIEPCILAGTPEKACGECGAPWEREIAAIPSTEGRENWAGQAASKNGASRKGGFYDAKRETIGWQPTCDHGDDSGRSTVLDPFNGAGTTGLVALRHNRSYIGIELNPEYCEMARNRLRDDAPLLNIPLEVAA